MGKKSKKSKRWFVGLRRRREAKKDVSEGFICEGCGCKTLVLYSSNLVNDAVLCAKCFYGSCDRPDFVFW